MNKLHHLVFIPLSLLLLVSACDKTPINGDLDGMWQLTRIEKFDANGLPTDTFCQKDIFWSFQLHLVELGNNEFFGRFQNNGDTLRVYEMYYFSGHVDASDDDRLMTGDDVERLHPYGLYQLDNRLRVERLDGEKMRLRNDSVLLTFRKF